MSINWEHRKQVAKERLTICNNCPKYIVVTTQCKECGCIMLAKTMFASSECPLNKWGKDETTEAKDQ